MWNMRVSKCCWAPYLFTLLTHAVYCTQTRLQSRAAGPMEQSRHCPSWVGCIMVLRGKWGVETLLLVSPSASHFPTSTPRAHVVRLHGAESRYSWTLLYPFLSVSPEIPVPDTEARPFISRWFVLGVTEWSESFTQPLPSPQLCWRGSYRLTPLKIPRPLVKCLSSLCPVTWWAFCLCWPCPLSYCNPKEPAQQKAGCGQKTRALCSPRPPRRCCHRALLRFPACLYTQLSLLWNLRRVNNKWSQLLSSCVWSGFSLELVKRNMTSSKGRQGNRMETWQDMRTGLNSSAVWWCAGRGWGCTQIQMYPLALPNERGILFSRTFPEGFLSQQQRSAQSYAKLRGK